MSTQELIAKKQLYEAKKIELIEDSHESEILEKVKAFREEKEKEILDFEANLRSEVTSQKCNDLLKVEHYLELINILIEEARVRDAQSVEEAVAEQVDEKPEVVEQVENVEKTEQIVDVIRPIMSL